jgi:hypothetical protein
VARGAQRNAREYLEAYIMFDMNVAGVVVRGVSMT